jgi:protein arginine kinase activator
MHFLCQNCNEAKATVHITDTYPEKRSRHLCEECAAKEGVIFKQSHETTQEILQQFIKHKIAQRHESVEPCPQCGMTVRDFQTKGLVGCPDCYTVFGELLTPLIERAHEGANRHVGKVPVTADRTIRKQTGLLRLKRELKEAIEKENYEEAARVRDQIKALETA